MRATCAISSDHGASSLWDTPSSCLTVWLCLAVVQVLALFPNPINTRLIATAVVMTPAAVVVFFSAAGLQQNLHAIHVVVAVTISMAMDVVADMLVAKKPCCWHGAGNHGGCGTSNHGCEQSKHCTAGGNWSGSYNGSWSGTYH